MSELSQDFAHSPVPESSRKGFWPILVVMVGFTFFSASMWSGGALGQGLNFSQFLTAVMIGNLLLGLYTAGLAYIGSKSGLSTHLLTQYAFGRYGAKLTSLVLSFTQVGWFGVGVAMFALPVNKATGIDVNTLVLASGILMTLTAFFGFKALTILSFVAVPAILVLGGFSISDAVTEVGGLSALFGIEPKESMGYAAAISICVGSFISGGTLTADFTRFAKSPKVAVSATLIAFFLGNTLMFTFGAIGSMVYGQADISEVMFIQGLILPAVICLGLNIWTTNDNALYVSGLGFASITGMSKNLMVVINGTLGTLFAIWLNNNFVGWLSLLNTALPPIGAILLADYLFVRRGQYREYKQNTFIGVNTSAMISWLLGVLAASYLPGIAPLNGILAASICHVFFEKTGLFQQKQTEVNHAS
ncbi:cytosine permease [Endozoicomonas numazuensis]|uniref:Cytosine permease n=1 Tax=Endozoicomonas numazuensis TaxID=1137799 RepID=A0A081N3W4_9GAMM|nr:cytosine permease [Endozoicomonas numazuensis]KEQ13137.1 cytosine permease [Endozoicomonas numazuensis]